MQNTGATPNALYVNDGSGNFTEPLYTTGGIGGLDTLQSIAQAIGDYNNDGLLDMVVSGHTSTPFQVFKNQNNVGNNYLKVGLVGVTSNRDGIGTLVEMYIGGNKYT